jgi:hypothetical protein
MSLVEAKRILTVKSSDASADSASDSVPLVLAPSIKLSEIGEHIDKMQAYLQENYKFETRLSGQRLKLGFRLQKEGFLCVEWAVFADGDNGKKNVFAVYKQALLTNYTTDADTGKVAINLKTVELNIIDDIVCNFREKLISVTDLKTLAPLPAPESEPVVVDVKAAEPLPKTPEQIAAELEQLKKEEEAARLKAEKEAAEAKKKAEEELAARSPLEYKHLTDLENTDFLTSGELYWGGLSAGDFSTIAVDEVKSKVASASDTQSEQAPVSVVVPAQPAPPTKEELNARGKQEFADSNLHVNTFLIANAVQNVLRPFVSMVLPPTPGSSQLRIVNEPTVYAVNDLQYVFENDYAKVLEERGKVTLMLTPVVALSSKAKAQSLTLYSGDADNFVLAPVSSVETFGIVFELQAPEFKVTKLQFSGIQTDVRTQKFLEASVSKIKDNLLSNNLITKIVPPAQVAQARGPDIKGTFDQKSTTSQKSKLAGGKSGSQLF